MALTDKLKAIADAIRGKTGKTEGLTLDQMPEEIAGIETGGGGEQKIYTAPSGAMYTPIYDNGSAVPTNAYQWAANLFRGAEKIEEVTLRGWENISADRNDEVISASSAKKLFMPDFKASGLGYSYSNSYICTNCKELVEIVLGSVGCGVVGTMYANAFSGCSNSGLTITVYTTAEILADVPSGAPWGATNATIIYRNSTTGEVITE